MHLSELSFTPEEEAEVVREQFKEVYWIFEERAILDDGGPVMCEIHDIFGTYDSSHHNCLGCNFADSTQLIANFLRTYELQDSINYAYSTFVVLSYLLVERIETLFHIIKLEDQYRKQNFKVLMEIRRWANFLKHPKAFLLTHHPTFSFEGSPKNKELRKNATEVITYAFLDQFYMNDKQDGKLLKRLQNKENVLVIFPDVVKVTDGLCKAMHDCVSLIRDNKVYRSILEERTTFRDYWIDQEED